MRAVEQLPDILCVAQRQVGEVEAKNSGEGMVSSLDQSPCMAVKEDYTILAKGQRRSTEGVGTISCALPASLQYKQWTGFKSHSGNVRSVVRSRKLDKRLRS